MKPERLEITFTASHGSPFRLTRTIGRVEDSIRMEFRKFDFEGKSKTGMEKERKSREKRDREYARAKVDVTIFNRER